MKCENRNLTLTLNLTFRNAREETGQEEDLFLRVKENKKKSER